MGNTSKEAAKYEVYFLQTGDLIEEASEILRLAFEAMDKNQLEPAWITVLDCLKISKNEAKLFVVDPFEGVGFQHLKLLNCRIVGPLCILYCLQYNDMLPKRAYPIYSVSMRKITVSCSNIPALKREEICSRVQLMGGFFSKDLTKSVSHLIVGEVGSQKYKVAASFGLPIMVPEWINDVWENGQYKQLHGSDSYYQKYKCPVFKGLVITVSQLTVEERQAVKVIVEKNGGSYSGALKVNETTHLVLNEPTGEKFRFAKTWKVICVKPSWIYESVEAGYCRDESLYPVDESSSSVQKRSTPKKDLTSIGLPLVDCSAIAGHPAVSHLDETMKSDVTFLDPGSKRKSSLAVDDFNLNSLPKNGQFLDGCKIFLTGFSPAHMDKLRKIVNAGGGIRFSKYNESISHAVCGELGDEFMRSLKSSSTKPFVVNCNWLLECCFKRKLVDEKPFLMVDGNTLSPEKTEASELKKEKSAHALATSSQPGKKSYSTNASQVSDLSKKDEFITDILQQYINKNEDACENKKVEVVAAQCLPDETQVNANNLDSAKESEVKIESGHIADNCSSKKPSLTSNHVEETDDVNEDDEVTILFKGLKFIIVGFGEKDTDILSHMIETHSGSVLMDDQDSAAVAIVPLIWKKFHIDVSVIVTNCWLQKCIEESRIFDFDENDLFRPFDLDDTVKPFQSFVLSFSQYVGTERICLTRLSESLGAVCQDFFVRKANPTKGALSNTHLVVSVPEGSKYEASKKWKIPAVTKQWVIDAAKTGIAPDVEAYLVSASPDLSLSKKEKLNDVIPKNNQSPSSVCDAVEKKEVSLGHCSFSELSNGQSRNNLQSSQPPCPRKISVDVDSPEFKAKLPCDAASTPKVQHNRVAELRNQSVNKSPQNTKSENSLNSSLGLNESGKVKFHVSGILKELDASVSQENVIGSRRHSLPEEEMFGRNLVCAVKRLDEKSLSELSLNGKLSIREEKEPEKPVVFKGVVLCVSKKLNSIQTELNKIVLSLGGDCIMSYDKSCTHFVFVGKANDLAKEFREARSHGKKIVCPDWVHACQESGTLVSEEAYPHTYKANMSLSQQISITKMTSDSNAPKNESIKAQPETETKVLDPQTTTNVKSTLSGTGNEVDFNEELNKLLVKAKSAKKRNSKILAGSVSSSPVSDISPIQKQQRHTSEVFVKPTRIDDNATDEMPDTCSSQLSQTYPIVWDDPTDRQERAKIAAKNAESLKRTNLPKSEKQVHEHEISEIDLDSSNDASIAVPVKKFMFSNMNNDLKADFIKKVKELGGEVSDERCFDMSGTHLVVSSPIKNEKFLSSVASGKWVIHPNYIIESSAKKEFLNEEDFEWGGPNTHTFLPNLSEMSIRLSVCPHRWRLKVHQGIQPIGAFNSWRVVVHSDDKTKFGTYSMILEAGGAEVITVENVEQNLGRITHVFVDVKQNSSKCNFDLSYYCAHNIKCVKPEYLAFFLIDDPPPPIDGYIYPYPKETLANAAALKKRNISSANSTSSRHGKRTKLK